VWRDKIRNADGGNGNEEQWILLTAKRKRSRNTYFTSLSLSLEPLRDWLDQIPLVNATRERLEFLVCLALCVVVLKALLAGKRRHDCSWCILVRAGGQTSCQLSPT
jgi:hypothetical protein